MRSFHQTQKNTEAFNAVLDEGLITYADHHCVMETSLADTFEAKWRVVHTRAASFINGEHSTANEPAANPSEGEATEVVELKLDAGEGDDSDDGEGHKF